MYYTTVHINSTRRLVIGSAAVKSDSPHGLLAENFPGSDVAPDEWEFLKAMERYQRVHQRRYPSWREVLMVLKSLGYRKAESQE